MYEDEYEFDYDRVADDADELYTYPDYSDEPDDNYGYDHVDERLDSEHYEYYYHNLTDEIDE